MCVWEEWQLGQLANDLVALTIDMACDQLCSHTRDSICTFQSHNLIIFYSAKKEVIISLLLGSLLTERALVIASLYRPKTIFFEATCTEAM
jgi:hypothetical protein